MAKQKNEELSRISINLPNSIIEKVKNYADSLGINVTSAYIVLLNQALEQKDMMSNLPLIFSALNEMKTLENNLISNDTKDK